MMRFDALPTVQAGGMQPYAKGMAREPGQALLAMLAGRTLYGQNPADIQRGLQTAVQGQQPTLLTALNGTRRQRARRL